MTRDDFSRSIARTMPDSPIASAWLVNTAGERLALGATCALGRSSVNDIVIATSKISRRHATVHQRAPGEFWLADLGSVNGTWLNERRIAHPTRLFDGDRIAVGDAKFVFQQPGVDAKHLSTNSGGTVRDVREEMCWLLVADIADSTLLSRKLAAPDYAALVAKWMERSHALVEAHAGRINRWQGDSLLAVWLEKESAPGEVAAAMWALAEYFMESKIESRIVVHRGKVAFGGANSTGEENLLGSEVNFIFRLEKLAARLREPVVVSAAAAAALQQGFPTKRCGAYVLKGFPGRHECWVLPTSRRVVLAESRDAGESTIPEV